MRVVWGLFLNWLFGFWAIGGYWCRGKIRDGMVEVDINLTARGEQVREPWVWRLARDFECKVTITKANVDTDLGWMQIKLEGPVEEVQRATAWLMTTGLHVDAEQRSVGSL